MKVIVLSNTKYKENDIIYNAISEEGLVSFKVNGAQSGKSPYLWLNNYLTIADIEFGDRRFKYPSLKEAKLVSSPLSGNDSLPKLMSLAVLAEATNKMIQDEEKHLLFKDLEGAVEALKNGKDHSMVVLIYLAKAITLAGAELEVDSCVFCGTRSKIVAFSFEDGGFICEKCFAESGYKADLTPNQMMLIRYAFKSPNFECNKTERYSIEDKSVVLKHLEEYIYDYLGVRIESLKNIIK